MPSTGMPSSSSAVSSFGAPSAYTLAGPPERMSPFGRRETISSIGTWWGSSSLKTPLSRTRRAMSCEYCPPKSRTTTSSTADGARTSVVFSGTTSGAALAAVTRPASNSVVLAVGHVRHRGSRGPAQGCAASEGVPLARRGPTRAAGRHRAASGTCVIRGGGHLRLRQLALGVARGRGPARAHPDALRALEVLALRLQRRRDH